VVDVHIFSTKKSQRLHFFIVLYAGWVVVLPNLFWEIGAKRCSTETRKLSQAQSLD